MDFPKSKEAIRDIKDYESFGEFCDVLRRELERDEDFHHLHMSDVLFGMSDLIGSLSLDLRRAVEDEYWPGFSTLALLMLMGIQSAYSKHRDPDHHEETPNSRKRTD